MEVFTGYTQDRVLLRLVEQIFISQQRLPSTLLTFQFLVVRLSIFIKILFVQLVLLVCRVRILKKCGVRSRLESQGARQCQLMDSGG